MKIELTATLEDFISLASAARNQARDFERLSKMICPCPEGEDDRLERKIEQLRSFAACIDSQVEQSMHSEA